VASPALLPYTQARIKWGVTAPAPGPLSRAKVAGSLVLTENPLGTDFFSLSDGRNPAWYGNAGGNNTAVPVKDTQVGDASRRLVLAAAAQLTPRCWPN
jgi:hypothetical protein